MTPIRTFYHICLIHSWQKIVLEQMRLIEESGLYDACEKIHIGCCGSEDERKKLDEIIAGKEKYKIYAHSPDIKAYEFITLKLLRDLSLTQTNEFYAMYIHNKSVSYSDRPNNVGKYWVDFMNYWTISKWKSNVENLDLIYDTCGTQIRTCRDLPAKKLHYSGNFFWVKSGYVKTLKPIEELNRLNRWEAEMWICSNNPLACTLSQEWVDYNTKGIFTPRVKLKNTTQIRKGMTRTFTLGFNTVSEITKATERLHAQNEVKDFSHTIFDLGFPLETGDDIPEDIEVAKENNSVKLKVLSAQYGYNYMKMKNEGVSQNWRKAIEYFKPTNEDCVIGLDPDEVTLDNGWVKAMADVLRGDEKIALVCLIQPEQIPLMDKRAYVYEEKVINGVKCYIFDGVLSWALIGLSGEFLNLIGGNIPVPTSAPIYGYIEAALMPQMKKHGYRWAFLPDYRVQHTNEGKLYRAWKDDIIHGAYKGKQIQFEDWLKIKKQEKI